MDKSETRYIGFLSKLHGFSGEFNLVSDNPLDEDIENWESVLLEIDGLLIPFFIDSFEPVSDFSARIGFEDIDSSEAAKEFIGCKIYQLEENMNSGSEDLPETFDDDVTDFKVIDYKAGFIGTVDSILQYSTNVLLRIINGDREILVPVSDEIIISVDFDKKTINIESPEGLLEL